MQGLDLGPDDFGGPSLEGCNEMLCLTRPDVIADMHTAFLDVGVDAIETASFGSFSTVLAEYDIAEKAHELNVVAARIAREVADGYATDGRPRYVAGSIGPGTKLPSLGHMRFADLRDAYEEQAHGLLEGGVDLFIIETVLRPAAGQGRDRRLSPSDAVDRTSGAAATPGHDGDDGSDAGRIGDRRRRGVAGGDAARRPRHQLRHRTRRDAGTSALPQPALPRADQRVAQRRPALDRRRSRPLRPHAGAAGRAPRSPRPRARRHGRRRAAAARRPNTCAPSSTPSATSRRPRAPRRSSPASARSTARSRSSRTSAS